MNLNNISLIIIGVIGLKFSLFILLDLTLILVLHPGIEDPVRLKWLAIGNFLSLPFIFSIAAIRFGIYNWR